jgi:hypothetical protein
MVTKARSGLAVTIACPCVTTVGWIGVTGGADGACARADEVAEMRSTTGRM